tara:strand:- start:389 stop:736 length:348 start_codon:yes stop_codon:yes gene_type:complete
MSSINFENSNTPTISLMCKRHDYEYNTATGTFVTGDWVISENKQRELLGEKVTLTEFKDSEAYLGGRITGFIPSDRRTTQTQVKVVFQPDPSLSGDTTHSGHKGWGTGRSVCYLD